MTELIKVLDLQTFAEEGGAVADTQGISADSGVATTNDSNGEIVNPERDLAKEFDELIKGEYKDVYGQKVEAAIGKRFKNAKDTQSRLDALTPVLTTLADKYGITDINDTESILNAMAEDDSYYEDEALEKGMSVQDLKAVKKVERENKELHRQIEEAKHKEETDRIYNEWLKQSEATKQLFPDFDLNAELQNEGFNRLLMAGVDVKTAFQVIHQDEIVPMMMQHTAQTVEQKIANSIANNGARPTENAGGNQAASVSQRDVSSLSNAEADELIARAKRGERITFRD